MIICFENNVRINGFGLKINIYWVFVEYFLSNRAIRQVNPEVRGNVEMLQVHEEVVCDFQLAGEAVIDVRIVDAPPHDDAPIGDVQY